MSILRYSITVQFDIDAGDALTLETKMIDLAKSGTITQIKAKSAGKTRAEEEK